MSERPPSRADEERALVAACVAGDPRAWDDFVRTYRPLVLRVSRDALVKAGADDPDTLADDVCGEVFAELLAQERKALSRFQAPFSLPGWLAVVARRRAIKVLRRARSAETLEEPERLGAGNRTVASDVASVEQHDLVRQHIDQLAPRDKLALQLFYEGGRSYKEVAQILQVPAERVGTLLARARARLAKSLGIST